MVGLGFRREMLPWNMQDLAADFHEVVPENWLRRNRDPLHRLKALGRPVHLHGVSLNLGGHSPINRTFLLAIRDLIDELGGALYSDHLAASGDAHQLYDLFPIPFTQEEILRVSDRIKQAQDILGLPMAIENSSWYTNIGPVPELEFVCDILQRAQCSLLLDINNLFVNYKNHGHITPADFVAGLDVSRVTYLHVAGHEYDARFGMYIDTHSQAVEADARALAQKIHHTHNIPILLEWDNDVPDQASLNEELLCLRSTITCAA
jgi:uncharacterized protein